jgi:uncharacterized cupin superfamily protein
MKNILNIADIAETAWNHGAHWGSFDKPLTPMLEPKMGHLGVVATRVKPGMSACPFHAHQIEDEAFFVLSGRGVFRYGEEIQEIRVGDCISCPAGTGVAHQIANPFDQDLVYLAIGMNDPNEVAVYPDTGKIMVRSLHKAGVLGEQPYMEGEPDFPTIFSLRQG